MKKYDILRRFDLLKIYFKQIKYSSEKNGVDISGMFDEKEIREEQENLEETCLHESSYR